MIGGSDGVGGSDDSDSELYSGTWLSIASGDSGGI